MVAEEPLPPELLAKLVGTSVSDVEDVCEALASEYAADGRGFILARVAGGRYQTATEQAPYVERFVLTASQPGCRRRHWRRLRSLRTSSRFAEQIAQIRE